MVDLTKRNWRNVELEGDAVRKFKEYCREKKLKYYPSEAGDRYVHFEVLVSTKEETEANRFLDSI